MDSFGAGFTPGVERAVRPSGTLSRGACMRACVLARPVASLEPTCLWHRHRSPGVARGTGGRFRHQPREIGRSGVDGGLHPCRAESGGPCVTARGLCELRMCSVAGTPRRWCFDEVVIVFFLPLLLRLSARQGPWEMMLWDASTWTPELRQSRGVFYAPGATGFFARSVPRPGQS